MLSNNELPQAPGWVGEEEPQNPGIFVMVAEWLNQVLPIGGVEAGRMDVKKNYSKKCGIIYSDRIGLYRASC